MARLVAQVQGPRHNLEPAAQVIRLAYLPHKETMAEMVLHQQENLAEAVVVDRAQ
jgi:hypothetical protein